MSVGEGGLLGSKQTAIRQVTLRPFWASGSRILTTSAITKAVAAMATHPHPARLALRPVFDRKLPSGAWWPESRTLSDQLGTLFASWPPEAGRIVRVLYSPPDWDDRPRSVGVGGGRRIKTGSFPHDDTQQVTLSMMDGERRAIRVIAPDSPPEAAAGLLARFAGTEASQP
jgi:Family of unknown function (DUF5994)